MKKIIVPLILSLSIVGLGFYLCIQYYDYKLFVIIVLLLAAQNISNDYSNRIKDENTNTIIDLQAKIIEKLASDK